ncbi:polysaccharide biosynthesis protein (plasmid) [halophilic archaeon DL31]|jgi:O-antigen/teichoic acid export membrane protein|nr:polysaccharide biosynthesis protein [halophilic archaeon DL31]
MNITRSSFKVFGANSLGAILGFVGITFFARQLTPYQLGAFFIFQSLFGLLSIPSDFGIDGAVNKRISEGKPSGAIFSTALAMKFLPLLLITILILLFKNVVNSYIGKELSLFLVGALVLQASGGLVLQTLKGELRVGETALPKLFQKIIYVCLGAVLIIYGFGVFGLVYSFIAGLIVMILWASYRSSIRLRKPSIAQARSLTNYSKYAVLFAVKGHFYSWVDVAVISLFLTQSHVSEYELAWRITIIVILLSRAVGQSIFPQISQWHAEGKKEQIEELISRGTAMSLFLVIPAFFGSLVLSTEILGVIFGEEYATAGIVLIILMGEKLFQGAHVILGRSLQAIDQPKLAAKATVIALVLNVLLNLVLIWKYGIIGAAVATTISFSMNTIIHAKYLSNFVSIRIPYNQIGGMVAASSGMLMCVLVMKMIISADSILSLTATIIIGTLIYILLTLAFPSLRELMTDTAQQLFR